MTASLPAGPGIQRLSDITATWAARTPDRIALTAPGWRPLTYRELHEQIQHTAQALRASGIGRQARVAVVLPAGPDLAVALLSIAAATTCTPLNPSSTARELGGYFAELEPAAVVLGDETSAAQTEAARAHAVRIITLTRTPAAAAGRFELATDGRGVARDDELAKPGDVALVLPTSGTTARPRLVPLTHGNLIAAASAIATGLHLRPEDRSLTVMPLFHVHGIVAGLLAPLLAGGGVACPPGWVAPRFFEWLDALEPTWYTAVPAMHQAVVTHAHAHAEVIARRRLRFVRSCSSALPPSLHAELERVFGVPVIEAYGMTEAAHQITSNPLPPGTRKRGSVGRAAGAEVAILGDQGEALPAGSPGQVVVRGPGVMGGYLADEEDAGDQTFVDGWLRTGDLGYLDGDGDLFLTGRVKEVINRAGEKISPREVEHALMEHPGIAVAVAFPIADPKLGEDVGAAVIPRAGTAPTVEEVRRFVGSRLPIHKVPRRIRIVGQIPMGPTGKIQRLSLAEKLGLAPTTATREAARRSAPPHTPLEQTIAAAWRQVLGVDEVGVDDDFLDVGGDSILATALAVRLRELVKADLVLVDLLDAPTIADQARLIEAAPPASEAAPGRRPSAGAPTMSHAQERLWFMQQLEPDTTVNHRAWALRLTGPLDAAALEASLREIVRRHEPLRARFAAIDGRPAPSIAARVSLTLPMNDLREVPAEHREVQLRELTASEAGAPFDLSRGPLFRARLVRLQTEAHVLVLCAHHIAFDAFSERVFNLELARLYPAFAARQPSPLPPVETRYSDLAAWQRDRMQGRVLEGLLGYWKAVLREAPDTLALPIEESGPGTRGAASAVGTLSLPPELSRELAHLARREGVTVFMLLTAALELLLGRLAGQDDVVVGVPVSGRSRPETETLIGLFINMLPVRVDLSGNPAFRQLLARVQRACRDAYAHQELPFEKLVAALSPNRAPHTSPLFNVVVNQRPAPRPEPIPGLQVEPVELAELDTGYALTLYLGQSAEAIQVRAVSRRVLLSEARLTAMLSQLEGLLEQVVHDPDAPIGAYSLRSRDARGLLPDPARPLPEPRYPMTTELFADHVRRDPDAPAVTQAGRRWSYGELSRASEALRAELRRQGLEKGDVVAVSGRRSFGLICALLGVLQSGGILLAVDPELPPRRQQLMLEEARAKWLVLIGVSASPGVAASHTGALLVIGEQDGRPPGGVAHGSTGSSSVPAPAPDDPAYLFFTTGTTGRPRGVLGRHKGIDQFLAWQRTAFDLGPADRVAQLTNLSFDPILRDVFLPLTSGAVICLPDPGVSPAAEEIVPWLAREGVTILHVVPSLAESWLTTAPSTIALDRMRAVFFAGETLRGSFVRRWRERFRYRGEIVNLYGPTETTMVKCFHRVPADAGPGVQPIGRAMPDTQALILSPNGRPCGISEPGEIVLRTPFRTLGYLDPIDTAARFRPNPWSSDAGDLLYFTGDAARYRLDGTIDFLGRLDHEVKVRGVRIDPGEVTIALSRHPAVRTAAVVAHAQGEAGHRLTAYVVADPVAVTAADLRAHLALELPPAMVPAAFVFLQALPLSPNGKVDIAALPPPPRAEPSRAAAPDDELEAEIARIWADMLAVPRVGRDDDFFDLGGHSLLALRVLARIAEVTGQRLPALALFQAPTVGQLARLVREAEPATGAATVIPIQPHGRRLPIFWMQPVGRREPSYALWRRYRELAGHLGPDQPCHGVQVPQAPGAAPLHSLTAEAIAQRCLPALTAFQPEGRYILGGLSFGGVIAWELAQQLLAAGRRVELVILVDSLRPGMPSGGFRRLHHYGQRFAFHRANLARFTRRGQVSYIVEHVAILAQRTIHRLRRRRREQRLEPLAPPPLYTVRPYPGRVLLLRAQSQPWGRPSRDLGWSDFTPGGLEIRDIPGGHLTMVTEPHVGLVARHLTDYLARLREEKADA